MSGKRILLILTRAAAVLGIIFLMTGLILAAVQVPVKAQNIGSIWTTNIGCENPAAQDDNAYARGEWVYVRGLGWDEGVTIYWTIEGQPGGASSDPGVVVASGTTTAGPDSYNGGGYFCVQAYQVASDDSGTYNVTASYDADMKPGKSDSYRVEGEEPAPALTIDKTAAAGAYDEIGDVLTYTLTATNTGNVPLTGVTISDPMLGALTCTPAQPAELAVGASMTCTGSYTITQADLDAGSVYNVATANSNETDPTTDDETIEATRAPALNIVKTAGMDTYDEVGDVILYTLVTTNTGNITLTGVTISDPMLGTLTCTPAQPASLAPGENMRCTGTYTITQADLDAGSVVNTATADSNETGPVADDEIVTAVEAPTLSIIKTADPATYDEVGDVINYTLVATNTGAVTLTGVTISDPMLGTLTCTPAQPADLAPGESLSCTGAYTITQADLDTGTVTNAATADSNETDEVTDDEIVTAVEAPGLSIVKTADPTIYNEVGDVITYTLVATNTGNVTLTGVTISDPMLVTLTCTPAQPASLSPGDSLSCMGTYTITQADLDAGSVVNTGTADSNETDEVTDDEIVTTDGAPVLSIIKTAEQSTYDEVGDVINYTLVATNEGNVTLTGVTISDPMLGTLTCTPAQPADLAPGESLSCTGTYTITQADLDTGTVTNTAAADSNETDEVTDDEIVTAVETPGLSIVKTAAPTIYDEVGDVITYTLVATNTGNVTLTGVTISDPMLGTLTCTPAQPVNLAPGESLSCTGTYTITQADLDAGSVVNTGTADSNETDEVTDDEIVTADGVPVLSIVKMAEQSTYDEVGDVINYTLTATNEGNVTLTGVTISDPMLGALICTPEQPASLAPEETLSCTGTYTITEADLIAGSVTNTATADSNETDEVTDDEVVTGQLQAPLVTITADDATTCEVEPGEECITFTVTVSGLIVGSVEVFADASSYLDVEEPVAFTENGEYQVTICGDWPGIQDPDVRVEINIGGAAEWYIGGEPQGQVGQASGLVFYDPALKEICFPQDSLLFVDPFCYRVGGEWTMAVQVENPNDEAVPFAWSLNGGGLQAETAPANGIAWLANLPLGETHTIAVQWGAAGFAEQRARLNLVDCERPTPIPPSPPPGTPVPVTAVEEPGPVVESAELIPVTGIDLTSQVDLDFFRNLMVYLGFGFVGFAVVFYYFASRKK